MENLQQGEIVTLDDNSEVIIVDTFSEGENNYAIVMTNYKPLKIIYTKQVIDGDNIRLEPVDKETKERLFKQFEMKYKK